MPTAGTASAAAGVISLVLLTISVVIGVLVTRRRELPRKLRYPSRKWHEYASLLALGFLALHIVLAIGGPFSRIPWLAAVIPFVAGPDRLWLGLGALASDLLIAVVLTSVLRRHLGRRAWRLVHWSAYACWPAAEVHSLGLGIGIRSGRLFDLAIACLAVVVAAVCWRLAGVRSGGRRSGPVYRKASG
jgi:predicted ferric reductase